MRCTLAKLWRYLWKATGVWPALMRAEMRPCRQLRAMSGAEETPVPVRCHRGDASMQRVGALSMREGVREAAFVWQGRTHMQEALLRRPAVQALQACLRSNAAMRQASLRCILP